MKTKELIKEIQQLPINKRMLIVEHIIKDMRKNELKKKMANAVKELSADYHTDKELTVFTNIDFDNFYEAR